MVRILVGICLVAFLAGCQTTTDPRAGGLFSYSPEAYEKRAEERRTRLKELEREQIAEEQRNQQLTASAEDKRKQKAAVQQKVNATNKDIAQLKTVLDGYTAQNSQQQQSLDSLQTRLASLKSDTAAVQSGTSMNDTQKMAEAERLRREIERLTKETSALSEL